MKAFFASLITSIMQAFLYTRLGQWVCQKVTGGWCFVRKDDPRFIVTDDDHVLKYEGDPEAAPDKGVSNQRKSWKTWIMFNVQWIPGGSHVFIDIYNGQRMACLGRGFSRELVAIRAGHESGVIRLGVWRRKTVRVPAYIASLQSEWLQPLFKERWVEKDGGEPPKCLAAIEDDDINRYFTRI